MRKLVIAAAVLASFGGAAPALAQGAPSALFMNPGSGHAQPAGETDLPWGTTLKEAPSGNTSQSTYSPYNLQIPQEYCGRMPSIPGRAPTECVPTHGGRGWLGGWLFG
jgi:hypothetical protein